MTFFKFTLTSLYTLFLLSTWAFGNNNLHCTTDRDVFASGDKIMVKVWVSAESMTKTVYLDLCSFSGKHISGAKLKVENHRTEGTIQIPDSLKTGTYLLRAFYNQDQRKELYIRELLIANRFDDFTSNFTRQLYALNSNAAVISAPIDLSVPDTLKRREKSTLRLNIEQAFADQIEGDLCISVAKHSTCFRAAEIHSTGQLPSHVASIAENNGLVITGKVINRTNGLPATEATVFLSVSDSIPGFDYAMTGKDGRFHFPLKDSYGTMQVVIQAAKENENDQLKIVLDEKFNDTIPPFSIKTIEKESALTEEMKAITEVFTYGKIFNEQPLPAKPAVNAADNTYLFYGDPTHVVKPDEFFNLPDFSEIARELLTGVKYRVKNNHISINLMDPEARQYFDEQAFVLVDGVPVQDLAVLKDLGTFNISWIHTVLDYRFYGDITFPGVVSIRTRQDNLQWLKESERLVKYQFEGFQAKETVTALKLPAHYPDLRPVLLWEPNANPSRIMEYDFKCADITGNYLVKVTGKKKNGEMFQTDRIIHIK